MTEMKNNRRMQSGLSIYLDILRFFFSLLVLLSHARSVPYTGGLFWRAGPFAQPAVIGFFVLSGFVISYVVDHHEREWRTYIASRLSRLYSVIIPCLVLTAIFDFFGWKFFADHYQNAPLEIGQDNLLLRYLSALFMMTGMGILGYPTGDLHVFFPPGTNGPLWSLSNEIVYYLIFGVFFFFKSSKRYIAYAVLAVIAGPEVMTLFPIWVMGALAYRATHKAPLTKKSANIIFLLTTAFFFAIGFDYSNPFWKETSLFSRAIHTDYIVGLLISLNIYSASSLTYLDKLPRTLENISMQLGALTFPLYLCHRPLLQFFSGIEIDRPGTALQTTFLLGAVFIFSVLIKTVSDRLKTTMKTYLIFTLKP